MKRYRRRDGGADFRRSGRSAGRSTRRQDGLEGAAVAGAVGERADARLGAGGARRRGRGARRRLRGARRRRALRGGGSARRNAAGRLAAVARRIERVPRRDVGRARAAGRHDHAECRWNAERRARAACRSRRRRSISRCWRVVRRAGRDRGVPPQRRHQPRKRAVQHRDVRSREAARRSRRPTSTRPP